MLDAGENSDPRQPRKTIDLEASFDKLGSGSIEVSDNDVALKREVFEVRKNQSQRRWAALHSDEQVKHL